MNQMMNFNLNFTVNDNNYNKLNAFAGCSCIEFDIPSNILNLIY